MASSGWLYHHKRWSIIQTTRNRIRRIVDLLLACNLLILGNPIGLSINCCVVWLRMEEIQDILNRRFLPWCLLSLWDGLFFSHGGHHVTLNPIYSIILR